MGRSLTGRSVAVARRLGLGGVVLLAALTLALSLASPAAAATLTFAEVPQITIAAGDYHSVALMADGTLWAWGHNGYGQLGTGTGDTRDATGVGSSNDWMTVAAGSYHTVALKSDGSLWAWGWNLSGQLGDGSSANKLVPTRVGTDKDWVAVAAGGRHTLALKSDGSLWGWGENNGGELGDGTTDTRYSPVRIGTDTDWVAIAAGYEHSLALKSDGSLWAWGYNFHGQLGLGDTARRESPARVGALNDWAKVSAGARHTLAIKSDGSLWAWGSNAEGQLGDGTTTDRHAPICIEEPDSHFLTVAGGYGHSLAIGTDGSLWACGWNLTGQLGDSTIVDRAVPVRIGGETNWVALAAGPGHSLALRADGSLWTWGGNSRGELGDGTNQKRYYPIEILTGGKIPPPVEKIDDDEDDDGDADDDDVTFSDVAGSPYEAAIYDLATRQVITGFADGTYRPNSLVTRQQFAKMIVKALGLTVTGNEDCPFVDVEEQSGTDPFYPSKYVATCVQEGITTGKSATIFAPLENVIHQQLITMVVRAAGLPSPPRAYAVQFVPGQFDPYAHFLNARRAAYAGILDGLGNLDASYDFFAASTRGECAQLLHNLLQMR